MLVVSKSNLTPSLVSYNFAKNNFKLHPEKCTLLSRSIRWYGRIMTSEAALFDPRFTDGIRNMSRPKTGADLQ